MGEDAWVVGSVHVGGGGVKGGRGGGVGEERGSGAEGRAGGGSVGERGGGGGVLRRRHLSTERAGLFTL